MEILDFPRLKYLACNASRLVTRFSIAQAYFTTKSFRMRPDLYPILKYTRSRVFLLKLFAERKLLGVINFAENYFKLKLLFFTA